MDNDKCFDKQIWLTAVFKTLHQTQNLTTSKPHTTVVILLGVKQGCCL